LAAVLRHNTTTATANKAIATAFLQNVIQLNTSKYTITLGSGTLYAPNVGLPVDYLDYGLEHWNVGVRTANASFTISNNTVTAFTLEPTGGPLYSAYVISNRFETAQKIMQNYQTWTNDPDVNKMVTTLNSAGSLRNVTEQLDNINFEMVVSSMSTSFSWSYIYNGVDYSSVNLVISDFFGPSVSFSDNRAINSIGNTDIAVSEQQAITAAENFVKGFSYNVDFGTGTITEVKDLNINETNIQANLTSTTRDQTTLYPYWRVQIPLDHTYPGETYAVTVNVWADSGTVFNAQRQITPPPTSTSTFSFDSSALMFVLEVSLISIVSFVVALVIVLVYLLRVDRKNIK
jgi:hypothetical protein